MIELKKQKNNKIQDTVMYILTFLGLGYWDASLIILYLVVIEISAKKCTCGLSGNGYRVVTVIGIIMQSLKSMEQF